jgi:hypothetical protein
LESAEETKKIPRTTMASILPSIYGDNSADKPVDTLHKKVDDLDFDPSEVSESDADLLAIQEAKEMGIVLPGQQRRNKFLLWSAILMVISLALTARVARKRPGASMHHHNRLFSLKKRDVSGAVGTSSRSGGGGTDAAAVFGPPSAREPFSTLDPVRDLGLRHIDRPVVSSPDLELFQHHSSRVGGKHDALPTSTWYTNMLLPKGEPTIVNRLYTQPYAVDAAGPVPGLRLVPGWVNTMQDVMQLIAAEQFGLTLGATVNLAALEPITESKQYSVLETTELGLTLGWMDAKMKSNVVRGMPYGTMSYDSVRTTSAFGKVTYPTIASEAKLTSGLIDGTTQIDCSRSDLFRVDSEMELYFEQTDYTWMVFVSEPVNVQCVDNSFLQIKDKVSGRDNGPVTVRIALLEDCTKGRNQNTCQVDKGKRVEGTPSIDIYRNLLREHSNTYPGSQTTIEYSFSDDGTASRLTFDWDVQRMSSVSGASKMMMFALPHHFDMLDDSLLPGGIRYCKSTITGPACLVEGTRWSMAETLPSVGFWADRPPKPEYVPHIAEALMEDIHYSLPDFYTRGAGDTYFSGKMLGKLARIILIQEELEQLCQTPDYSIVCEAITLPSSAQFNAAIARLKSNVEVWFNGHAETEFIYDGTWGGMVSCGCSWNGNGCSNRAPHCPSLTEQGLNFGNGKLRLFYAI